MTPVVAHGSGIDELILFLAVPALFLIYHLIRRLLGRGGPVNRDVHEEPDEQHTGPPPH
jgi:hypothetical protein